MFCRQCGTSPLHGRMDSAQHVVWGKPLARHRFPHGDPGTQASVAIGGEVYTEHGVAKVGSQSATPSFGGRHLHLC